MTQIPPITFATRFRGFLPVVIDVETGGFNSQTDALLEIAAVFVEMRSDGTLARGETIRYHVAPFPGATMQAASLAVNGIDPYHPLRPAIPRRMRCSAFSAKSAMPFAPRIARVRCWWDTTLFSI